MKKVLKFAGAIACVLAIIAFILLMATPAATYTLGSNTMEYKGIVAVFGDSDGYKLAWSALLAWIFILVAIIILALGVILPLLKVKALDKFAGVLNLAAVILLIVAGIFAFCTRGAFVGANSLLDPDGWKLGVGYVFVGILAILGGLVAICPAVVDFIGKKK